MLRRFYVDNFKTLLNVEWVASAVNLLIGANNAGKTSLCSALMFLARTSQGPIKDAAAFAGEGWQLHNVYLDKPTLDFECEAELMVDDQPYVFDYALSLKVDSVTPGNAFATTYVLQSESLWVTPPDGERVALILNDRGVVTLLHEGRHFRGMQGEARVETHAPQDTTMLFRLYDLQTNRLANAFKKYLGSWTYYNLNPLSMRGPAPAQPANWVLNVHGDNLASVLFMLKNISERDHRPIVELTREIEPKLDSISFMPAQEQVFMWLSDADGHNFTPAGISDGTLRFLGLAYVIISTARAVSNAGMSSPPIVVIEEPENGIYVGMLRRLFDLIDHSGVSGQYVFTTHSPYVIDLFDTMLDGVRVCVRRDTHSELRQLDADKVRGLLGKFSLGELHFREMFV
jgi:predicted ATPase